MTSESSQNPSQTQDNCLSIFAFLVAIVWIGLAGYTRHFVSLIASLEPEKTPHFLNLIGGLIYAGVITFPLILLAMLWPDHTYRSYFRTWGLASLLIIISLPVTLINPISTQTQAVSHIALTSLLCLLIWMLNKRQSKKSRFLRENIAEHSIPDDHSMNGRSNPAWMIALAFSGLAAYPWLAWGALGSMLDSVVQIINGIILGLLAALLFNYQIINLQESNITQSRGNFVLLGLATNTTLFILVSALEFPYGAIQLILMFEYSSLGWMIVGLSWLTNGKTELSEGEHGKTHLLSLTFKTSALSLILAIIPSLILSFFDPEELSLFLDLIPGESLGYVLRAAWLTFLLIFIFTLITIFSLFLKSKQWTIGRWNIFSKQARVVYWILIGLILSGSGFTYKYLGQPGFFGEDMFVIFKDQANLDGISLPQDYDDRRLMVYHLLVDKAQISQSPIRKTLDKFGIDYTPYYLVNAIEIPFNPFLRLWLLTRPEIDRVLASPQLRPLPEAPKAFQAIGESGPPTTPPSNIQLIHADRVWEEFQVQGKGIVIGQSDSGVQADHPNLAESYRGYNQTNDYNWYDPWYHQVSPVDTIGHGTHTLGTIVGKFTGIAPQAKWIACSNLPRNLSNPGYYLDCWQFLFAPFPLEGDPFSDGQPTLGAQIFNNSWGCPEVEGCDANTFLSAVHALRKAGVFLAVSAGNEGPQCSTLNAPPAIYADVYSVGAIDDQGNLSSFSSIGPVTSDGSNRIKPDILAPGVNVLSSYPGNTYSRLSGTSMSGPHVAGVVALMWSANPRLIGDIDQTEEILDRSAKPYTGEVPACPQSDGTPSTAYGYGILDSYAAVKLAINAP